VRAGREKEVRDGDVCCGDGGGEVEHVGHGGGDLVDSEEEGRAAEARGWVGGEGERGEQRVDSGSAAAGTEGSEGKGSVANSARMLWRRGEGSGGGGWRG
jgi:hypothetical protein